METIDTEHFPAPRKVGYARSTWRKAKEFAEGVRELSQSMPLASARAYLTERARSVAVAEASQAGAPSALYARVEELQQLRKAGISAEMQYVEAQAFLGFRDCPVQAAQLVSAYGPDGLSRDEAADAVARAVSVDAAAEDLRDTAACARLLIGEAGLCGDDIRLGFPREVLACAPSLGVYELFLWFDESELANRQGDRGRG